MWIIAQLEWNEREQFPVWFLAAAISCLHSSCLGLLFDSAWESTSRAVVIIFRAPSSTFSHCPISHSLHSGFTGIDRRLTTNDFQLVFCPAGLIGEIHQHSTVVLDYLAGLSPCSGCPGCPGCLRCCNAWHRLQVEDVRFGNCGDCLRPGANLRILEDSWFFFSKKILINLMGCHEMLCGTRMALAVPVSHGIINDGMLLLDSIKLKPDSVNYKRWFKQRAGYKMWKVNRRKTREVEEGRRRARRRRSRRRRMWWSVDKELTKSKST